MKRSWIKRPAPIIKPLKPANPRGRPVLSAFSKSETATLKREIQALLREIVIIRDGGCIFRNLYYADFPQCGGYRNDGQIILQGDHLITRASSATYADSRLVVCVCKAHHGWKSVGANRRKAQYDEIVKTLISPERVALWEACERDSWRPTRNFSMDWVLAKLALEKELEELRIQF